MVLSEVVLSLRAGEFGIFVVVYDQGLLSP
ncbi:hypothetical protein SAMN05421753_102105 [Planctomicrobium piriforme]|uniref:Uncharacterized protein n=1 Tax=Planctomicrobium piriforme TaxID=1576369 RepID=A0A1I3C4I6_9PLAN|nr:hypothetical protein SAMN05421753_102105 [Planctomicrobium piriforme]